MSSPKGDVQELEVNVMHCDMDSKMQEEAVSICKEAVLAGTSESAMATHIKKKFDDLHPDIKWHCLVGKTYGGYFTHDPGSFLHVKVGSEVILLFRAS